jgi:hypothetical protein
VGGLSHGGKGVSENRVLGRIFGLNKDEGRGNWKKLYMRSFIICTPHPILLQQLSQGGKYGQGM